MDMPNLLLCGIAVPEMPIICLQEYLCKGCLTVFTSLGVLCADLTQGRSANDDRLHCFGRLQLGQRALLRQPL